jgi:hypothetical protein
VRVGVAEEDAVAGGAPALDPAGPMIRVNSTCRTEREQGMPGTQFGMPSLVTRVCPADNARSWLGAICCATDVSKPFVQV